MKRKFIVVLTLLFSALSAAGVISCAKAAKKLERPQNVRVEKRVMTWDKVEWATDYTVLIKDEEYKTKEPRFELYPFTEAGDYYYQVKACGDGKKYVDSAWTAGATELTQAVEHGYDELRFEYTLMEDKSGYEVSKGKADLRGVITIPDYFGEYPVKKIADEAFLNKVPNGKDALGNLLWTDATVYKNLANNVTTGIKLPSTLEEIGYDGLSCLIELKELVIPDSVKTMGGGAFRYDISLTRIVLPKGLKVLPARCLSETGLKEIELPETLEKIGARAFANTEVTNWIGAEHNPSDLSVITVPESVQYIGEYAFKGRENLKTVNISPDNLEYVGRGILGETAWYDEQPDGLMFLDKEQTVILDYKNMPTNYDLNIPSTTRIIAGEAFCMQKNLKSVTIPSSVRIYGESIFMGCSSLSAVNLPQNITRIPEGMFASTEELKNITLPQSVVAIDSGSFSRSGLERIELPPHLKTLESVFGESFGLKEVIFNEELENIAGNAFIACRSLTKIVLPKKLKSVGKAAFYNCKQLKTVILPSSLESIGQLAFANCDNLTEIFYEGSMQEWDKIDPGAENEALKKNNFSDAEIYCFSYIKPDRGNFWHYAADGVTPEIW